MQRVRGSIPGQGAKIPHASGPKNQNIKQKQYCNKFYKDFKNGPHQKKKSLKKRLAPLHLRSDFVGRVGGSALRWALIQ